MREPLSTLAVVALLVSSVVAGVGGVAASSSPGASPQGHVGVPTSNVDLPEQAQGSTGGQANRPPLPDAVPTHAAAWHISTSHHADDLTASIAYTATDGLVVDLTDDRNHLGREVAMNASAIEASVGHQPKLAYGLHESGERWTAEIEYRNGRAIFDVPRFSTNTVTFESTVSLTGSPASDGTQYQYNLSDGETADSVNVTLTGNENRVNATTSKSDVVNGGSVGFDVDGTADPDTAQVSITGSVPDNVGTTDWSTAQGWSNIRDVEVAPGVVFVVNGTDLHAVNPADGTLNWTETDVMANGNAIYEISYHDGEIALGNGATNAEVEVYPVQSNGLGTQRSSWEGTDGWQVRGLDYGSDGKIYISHRDIKQLNPSDGTVGWNYGGTLGNQVEYYNGDVYIIGNNYDMTSVSSADGSENWRVTPYTHNAGRDVHASEHGIIGTSHDGVVIRHDPADGSTIWQKDVGATGSSPKVDAAFGTGVVTTNDGNTFAMDVDDGGRTIWTTQSFSPSTVRGLHFLGDQLYTAAEEEAHSLHYTNETADPTVSLGATQLISHTGTLEVGQTATASVGTDIALGDGQTLDVSTSDASGVDVDLEVEEITETVDPAIEVNGDLYQHTGTLADGSTTTLDVANTSIQSGTNTVNVTVSDAYDGPTGQVGLAYSHGASEDLSVDYGGYHWRESYNVSKTYASDRSDAKLSVTFIDDVVHISNLETRTNGGTWQTVSSSNYGLDGQTLSVSIGSVSASDTVEVRAKGRKVKAVNGDVAVEEPSTLDSDLDTKLKFTSITDGFHIEIANTSEYVHHLANPSWTSTDSAYATVDASNNQELYVPTVINGSTARVRSEPLKVSPASGTVDVEIVDAPSNEFRLSGAPGTDVEVGWFDTKTDETYELATTDGDTIGTKTAESPVWFLTDGSEETYTIQLADGSSSSGSDPPGEVVVVSEGSSGFSDTLLLAVVGALVLALVVVGRRYLGITGRTTTAIIGIGGAVVGLLALEAVADVSIVGTLLQTGGGSGFTILMAIGILLALFVIDSGTGLTIPTWLWVVIVTAVGVWVLDTISDGGLTSGLDDVSALVWLLAIGGALYLARRALQPDRTILNIRGGNE